MATKRRQSSTVVGIAALIVWALALPATTTAQPPACEDDPTRTIFAGYRPDSCDLLRGDESACESAYYVNRREGDARICFFVGGACLACGTDNGACTQNTCNGNQLPMFATRGCPGDPDRTSYLGYGDNDSRKCRSLDHTDQATCENAYYNDQSDLDPTACFWDVGNGWCLGCGENSKCSFNACDTASRMATAPCTGDPSRTTLLGLGDNDRGDSGHPGACRQLDNTDQATCEDAWYEDDDDFLAVACWWNGHECRGSGEEAFPDFNVCLGATPPTADATCPEDPSRTLLGLGQAGAARIERPFRACRQFDGTDQATCEDHYYESEASGLGVACWWNAGRCRGSGREHAERNACQLSEPKVPVATCTDRSTFLGFGRRSGYRPCRSLSFSDQATCEDAFYESFHTGFTVACWWDEGDCRGCGKREEDCPVNECWDPVCEAGTRTLVAGRGNTNRSLGLGGGACNQFGDQPTCETAYYESVPSGKGTACWWDVGSDRCRGSGQRFATEDVCRVPAVCTREPGRTLATGFGRDQSAKCGDFVDETTCEQMYYENRETRTASACWWDSNGDICRGSSGLFDHQNACVREPAVPSATCEGDSNRTMSLGFGANREGRGNGPCHAFDGMQTECEMSYYEHFVTGRGIACWWDDAEDQCRGSSNNYAANNACFAPSAVCTEDPGRTNIGAGSNGSGGNEPRGPDGGACRQFDDTDQTTCEGAFYEDGLGRPVACWWDGDDCRGSRGRHFFRNACILPDPPVREATAVCDATPPRTMFLGFGNDRTAVCGQLDSAGETACEMAYYEDDDDGYAVACWWAGDSCRGSGSGENARRNDCAADPIDCEQDPDRDTYLGWGNNGRNGGSGPCRQFDGMREQCEDAYYRDKDSDESEAVACWFDGDECRGTNGDNSRYNSCYRGPVDELCKGDPSRTTLLGQGDNGNEPCRDLDDMQAACEDAFYVRHVGSGLLEAVACTWVSGANEDVCLGTSRFDALNDCLPDQPPTPMCPGRTMFVGRGGNADLSLGDQLGGACKQLDDETTCNQAYYVSADGEAVACWWDGSDCAGSNQRHRLMNVCRPQTEECNGRSFNLGFGHNDSGPCRALDSVGEDECHDAYYVDREGGHLVSCEWHPEESICMGCGRRAGIGSDSTCEENVCHPVACEGDPGRVLQDRCNIIEDQAECENSWHVTGTRRGRGGPPSAAACFWRDDGDGSRCRGCGPFQADTECSNACTDGCGDGDLDPGEQCDDGNLFDGDCCDSQCQLEADGQPCTDRLFCTEGIATCDGGSCVGEMPRPCAPCLTGDCDEVGNRCTHPDQDQNQGEEGAISAAALSGNAPPDMSMPLPEGTMCDDGIAGNVGAMCNEFGMCEEGTQPTPTATPTATVNEPTPVPDGAPCSESSQCEEDSACIEGFCAPAIAPAPAASPIGLLIMLLTVIAIGASTLRWRRRDA